MAVVGIECRPTFPSNQYEGLIKHAFVPATTRKGDAARLATLFHQDHCFRKIVIPADTSNDELLEETILANLIPQENSIAVATTGAAIHSPYWLTIYTKDDVKDFLNGTGNQERGNYWREGYRHIRDYVGFGEVVVNVNRDPEYGKNPERNFVVRLKQCARRHFLEVKLGTWCLRDLEGGVCRDRFSILQRDLGRLAPEVSVRNGDGEWVWAPVRELGMPVLRNIAETLLGEWFNDEIDAPAFLSAVRSYGFDTLEIIGQYNPSSGSIKYADVYDLR